MGALTNSAGAAAAGSTGVTDGGVVAGAAGTDDNGTPPPGTYAGGGVHGVGRTRGSCAGAGATPRGVADGPPSGAAGDRRGIGTAARARTGRTPAGVDAMGAASGARAVVAGRSSPHWTAAPTAMSPPHTEHRARMATLVIFAGSTLKTDRHSGQDTFIADASRWWSSRACSPRRSASGDDDDRPRRLSRATSWRTPSFPSQVRSPGRRL